MPAMSSARRARSCFGRGAASAWRAPIRRRRSAGWILCMNPEGIPRGRRDCARVRTLDQPTMPSTAPPQKRGPSSLALWANMAVVYVVWGSTYFAIAIAIRTLPPFLMASIRFAIAGAILITFDLLRHPEARHWPTRRQLIDSAIVGGLLLGVGNGFVSLAERTVPSGIAAILI